jgi:ABC-type polysaccharide/polyol phosphate transport system ATPase subunit
MRNAEGNGGGPAVRIGGLGVRYFQRIEKGPGGDRPSEGGLRRGRRELWALRGIDASVAKGEIFGVIGANGAGKSTLLKVLAGIIPPTEGSIEVEGTLAPFIELGAAFNPDLTGAENIFLTGSIYRVPRKEIRANFNRIVEFAELRRFIDTPVKNYSSGMFVRLAFSSILFFRPDVLLVDEVFAVGDEAFQQKSFEKVVSFKAGGAAVIIVSHDSTLIGRICDRALVLDRGRSAFVGPAAEAVDRYHDLLMHGKGLGDIEENGGAAPAPPSPGPAPRGGSGGDAGAAEKAESGRALAPQANGDTRTWGDGKVRIRSVGFFGPDGAERTEFRTGEPFEVRIDYDSSLGPEPPVFGVAFSTIYRLLIHGPNTLSAPVSGEYRSSGTLRFIVPRLPLLPGDYLLSVSGYDRALEHAYVHHEQKYHFRVGGRTESEFGCVRIDARWEYGER